MLTIVVQKWLKIKYLRTSILALFALTAYIANNSVIVEYKYFTVLAISAYHGSEI